MSAQTPPNPVTGPKQPPGFTGLRRWTDVRLAIPLLLIAGVTWSIAHPLAITQTAATHGTPDAGSMLIDSSDLVAHTPEPRETPVPTPHPLPSVRPSQAQTLTIATDDLRPVALASQPAPVVPAIAAEPAQTPTPSAAEIARRKRADSDQSARDAPLVAASISQPPVPVGIPEGERGGYWLRRGMSIAATLYTSIDSTVPGVIVAYVADDVYDFTHAALVIPRGAKLVGSFGGRGVGIAQGQARIPASFDSIQLADRVVALGDEPGIDRSGTSGLGGRIDRHTRATFESFAILAGVGLLARSNSCSNCEQSGSGNVGSTLVSAGTPLLPQPNTIQPTLHIAEGLQIAIMLTHDIRVQAWTP